MKIIIHALGTSMGGAMRHLTNFLPELGRQDRINRYLVLLRGSFPAIKLPENIKLERFPRQTASRWLNRLYLDNFVIPHRLKNGHFDLLITLTNFGPVKAPCEHILFQRNSTYFCHYYLARLKGSLKAEVLLRRKLAVEAMKRADLIVTPSNAMKEMIKDTCPEVISKSFLTLYHGYSKDGLDSEPLDSHFREMLDWPGIKLLYPTHSALHKGFEILFAALAQVKDKVPPFRLYAPISRADWPKGVMEYEAMVNRLGLSDHVVFMGRVPQQQMGAVYSACDIMVYPSLCESFGFSMVEAMGHGLPTVAVGTNVNKEILGTAALYYSPPASAEACAYSLQKAIQNTSILANLRNQARKRMEERDWSWREYVRKFLNILDMA